ncbi:MAG: pyridoxal 5'-phosphate synthase glutaminase subunit PdxT [Deltaproteobacteria bacterium]|nr:pyridoxal 5'-phosphate synthase glutaminase subunit PdxT [Deltaproteobacteria bacterium]
MSSQNLRIGILALQGAVQPHVEKLRALSAEPVEVRQPKDLDGLSGIILPGGESTTMIQLLKLNHLWDPLARFTRERPAWGLCAGTILLAKEVVHPAQESFGAIDISVSRNAFGRQLDSFIEIVSPTDHWVDQNRQEAVFIRAPRITQVGSGCDILFQMKSEPIMVRQGHALATTFHPELSTSDIFHRYFVDLSEQHG